MSRRRRSDMDLGIPELCVLKILSIDRRCSLSVSKVLVTLICFGPAAAVLLSGGGINKYKRYFDSINALGRIGLSQQHHHFCYCTADSLKYFRVK